jgi:RimJ/RimL family protein N-acetyltransferase
MDLAYETERLIVRNWRPDDADRVFDVYSRFEVARWLGATPKPMGSMEEARSLVDRWAALNDQEPVAGRWAVQRRDGVVAGTVILVPLPDGDGELEVGWHLHPDSWHHGYATEAAAGALTWAFDHGLDEVFAVVRPANAASIAVCRRLGMAELGLTDRYYGTTMELFRATSPGVPGSAGG